ncbi:MAG: glycosyltransferase family 2 protein [Candidatus Micrarchaeota archaeon]
MLELSWKSAIEYFASFLTLYFSVFFLIIFLQNRGRLHENPRPPKSLPSLTLVIPAYNEGTTLAKSIESALACDYPRKELEIIVVDDGSRDATLAIAKSYASRGVRAVTKKNGGKASALNLALKEAKGEFFATLDADSYMEKDGLRKMMGYFAEKDVGAVTSVMKVWRQETFWQKLQGVEYLVAVFTRRLQSFMDAINVTPGPLSIFKTRVLRDLGGFDEGNLLEDQEMALRLQEHHYRIKSSTNAIVYTDVPPGFFSLLRQRLRWYRGGMRNFISHYYMVSPRYGDFGVFFMPFAIVSIFVLFAVISFIVYSFATGFPLAAYFKYGWQAVVYSVTPLQLISVAILAFVSLYTYLGLRFIEREFISVPVLLVYLIFYTPVIILFWAVSFLQELLFVKLKW